MNAQSNPGPVDFDLSRGRVDRRSGAEPKEGADEQVVLIPVAALAGLEKAGPEVMRPFARAIGASLGRRVQQRMGAGDGVAGSSLEKFVSTLASEVAISGWGALHLERWGKAMVLVVEHAPSLPAALFAALLEGAVEAASARAVHGVALVADATGKPAGEGAARVLIASAKSAEQARKWLDEGQSEAEVLRRLHDQSKTGGAA